jgi:hypothetical protein
VNPAGVSWRPLLATAVAVLAIHLLLLGASSGPLEVANPLATRPLITRTIPAPTAPPTESTHDAAKPTPVATATPPRARAAAPSAELRPAVAQAPAVPQQPVQAPAVASPPPATFAVAGSVRLHYKVTAHRLNQLWEGQAELLWRHDGEQYEAKLEVSALLLPTRVQRSTGRITADGLAPLRFSDKARNEEAAHFERDLGKVIFSSNRPDAPLLPGAQDRLSVLLQLGALIAANPGKFGPDATILIQTASTRDAESWLFTVVAEEQLQLPGGNVSVLKLTRNPRKEFDQKVELWLAPAMDYVPVRLRLTQPNGDWLDQQWSSTDRG